MCRKCDKFNEEKPININNCTENYKYNDVIYYTNELYDYYISSQNYINNLNFMNNIKNKNNNPNKNLQYQEEELQIIEYPYEECYDSVNNCSKTTIKKYNLDDNIENDISPVKTTSSIKNIFSNISKKKLIKKKKNILLKGELSNPNNNNNKSGSYFLKRRPKKFLTTITDKAKMSKLIKKYCSTKPLFNNIKHKKKNTIKKK